MLDLITINKSQEAVRSKWEPINWKTLKVCWTTLSDDSPISVFRIEQLSIFRKILAAEKSFQYPKLADFELAFIHNRTFHMDKRHSQELINSKREYLEKQLLVIKSAAVRDWTKSIALRRFYNRFFIEKVLIRNNNICCVFVKRYKYKYNNNTARA